MLFAPAMSRLARLAAPCVLALSACGAPAPPPAPPVVVVTAAPPAPSPEPPAVPPPVAKREAAVFVPAAPFSIVATAPGDHDFAVFPLEDGAAVFAAAVQGDMARTLKLAVLDHDAIAPAPSLPTGLPASVFTDPDLPLVAGRWPDALWLARGAPCEVHQWQPQQGRWEPRPSKRPAEGKCKHLSAWTPGTALASVQGPKGPSLVAFGAVPRVVPVLPPRRSGQQKDCAALLGGVYGLFAFPTGEVISIGVQCDQGRAWLMRWAAGASGGDVIDAEIDPNTPFHVRVHTRTEIAVDGVGVVRPGDGAVAAEARFEVAKGHLRRVSLEEYEVNALESWMVQARTMLHLPETDPPDGFRYEGFQLTPTDDVFVMGHLMHAGKPETAVVLRNRPVKAALTVP